MDVILDETSLVPCENWSPAQRIQIMAATVKVLDGLGCARVLRSIQNAADYDIAQGHGLRRWCFDRGTPRDAGLLIANRLNKQPFLDGVGGLFSQAEGERVIEGRIGDALVVGLAYAALTNSPAVSLGSEALPACTTAAVELTFLETGGESQETRQACRLVTEEDARQQDQAIRQKVEKSVQDGRQLLERAHEIFPRLRFGPMAIGQISALTGNETVFHHLFRHLRALDEGAALWEAGAEYSPKGAIRWSGESKQTLNHREYGPQRDFPMPEGFAPRRWSNHTKLGGGSGARLYFDAEQTTETAVVLIGYFGDHLPIVSM